MPSLCPYFDQGSGTFFEFFYCMPIIISFYIFLSDHNISNKLFSKEQGNHTYCVLQYSLCIQYILQACRYMIYSGRYSCRLDVRV